MEGQAKETYTRRRRVAYVSMKKWVILPVYPGLEDVITPALLPYVGLLARGTHKREAVSVSPPGLKGRGLSTLVAITQEVNDRVRIIPVIDAVYAFAHNSINATWAPHYVRHAIPIAGAPTFHGLRSPIYFITQAELDNLATHPVLVSAQDSTDDIWRMIQAQKCDVHDYSDNLVAHLPTTDVTSRQPPSILRPVYTVVGRGPEEFFWNTSTYDKTKPQGNRVRRTVLVERVYIDVSGAQLKDIFMYEYDTATGVPTDIDIPVTEAAVITDITYVVHLPETTPAYPETHSIQYEIATNDFTPAPDPRDATNALYAHSVGLIAIMYALPEEDGVYDVSVKLRLSNWANTAYKTLANAYCTKKATLTVQGSLLTHIKIPAAFLAVTGKLINSFVQEKLTYIDSFNSSTDFLDVVNLGENAGSIVLSQHSDNSSAPTDHSIEYTQVKHITQYSAEAIIDDKIYVETPVVFDRAQNFVPVYVETYAQPVIYERIYYAFYNGALRSVLTYDLSGTVLDVHEMWAYSGTPDPLTTVEAFQIPVYIYENSKTALEESVTSPPISQTTYTDVFWYGYDGQFFGGSLNVRHTIENSSYIKVGWTQAAVGVGSITPRAPLYTDEVGFVSLALPITVSSSGSTFVKRTLGDISTVLVSKQGKTVLRWSGTLSAFLYYTFGIYGDDVYVSATSTTDVFASLRRAMARIKAGYVGSTNGADFFDSIIAEGQKIIDGYAPPQSESESEYVAKYLLAAATLHKTTMSSEVELAYFIKALKVGAFTSACIFP